ncbi:MAG: PTS sugar transporter subunit IIC [candidate division WOR-3 bacterium]
MLIITLALLGALLLLDKYAIGEFGISQPIISGTILGAIFGDIRAGILLGSAFQLIFLAGLPIGRDIPPDTQGAGIAGCGAYFILLGSNGPQTAFFIAVILGLLAGVYGIALEIWVREQNEKLFYRFMRNEENLILYHLSGILSSYLRGIILLLPVFLTASLIHIRYEFTTFNRELFIVLVASIGMANGIFLFMKKKNLFYLILGLICSLVFFAF